MAELNRIFLIGRLTKDPELRYMPSGGGVATLRMAVNHTWRPKDSNEKKEEVLYIDVNVFGRSAETVKQYLAKGREVFIEGRLQQNDWQDKSGQKRTTFRVVAERFQFIGGRGAGGGAREEGGAMPAMEEESGGPGPGPEAEAGEAPPAARESAAGQEDDLPF